MFYVMFKVNDPGPNPLSFAICLCTWSKVSHCEMLFSDGTIANTDMKHGVHFTNIKERNYDFYNWIALPIPTITKAQEQMIKEWVQHLVDIKSGYDTLGAVFGGIFGCQDGSKYFCSEMVAEALAPFIPQIKYGKWYSPKSLWKILAAHTSKLLQLVH